MDSLLWTTRRVADLRATFFWTFQLSKSHGMVPPSDNWRSCDFDEPVWESDCLRRAVKGPGLREYFSTVRGERRSRFYPWKELQYSERVYFLPFVEPMIYGRRDDNSGEVVPDVLQRIDVGAVSIQLNPEGEAGGDEIVDLWVPRVLLYKFAPIDVAVLAVEVSLCDFDDSGDRATHDSVDLATDDRAKHAKQAAFGGRKPEPVSFDTVLRLLNRFRRSFVPYYYLADSGDSGKVLRQGEVPVRVDWRSEDGTVLERVSAASDQALPESTRGAPDISARVLEHWAELLSGSGMSTPDSRSLLGDDRLPYLACVAVTDGWLELDPDVQRSDCIRLCFADEPGSDPSKPPYASNSLESFEEDYCYDRFWAPSEGWKTRWLSSGYALTALVTESDAFCNSVFRGVGAQIRHHYYQMCLIVHVQHAALLVLSAELANARQKAETPEGRRAIRDVYLKWLTFRHEYWFVQVSAQLQGKEIFTLLQRHLGLPDLFEQVRQEAAEIAAYVESREEEQQTHESLKQTEESLKQTRQATALSKVATVGLVLACISGLLGMNVPGLGDSWKAFSLAATVLFFVGLNVGLWVILRWLPRQAVSRDASIEDASRSKAATVGLVLATILVTAGMPILFIPTEPAAFVRGLIVVLLLGLITTLWLYQGWRATRVGDSLRSEPDERSGAEDNEVSASGSIPRKRELGAPSGPLGVQSIGASTVAVPGLASKGGPTEDGSKES